MAVKPLHLKSIGFCKTYGKKIFSLFFATRIYDFLFPLIPQQDSYFSTRKVGKSAAFPRRGARLRGGNAAPKSPYFAPRAFALIFLTLPVLQAAKNPCKCFCLVFSWLFLLACFSLPEVQILFLGKMLLLSQFSSSQVFM